MSPLVAPPSKGTAKSSLPLLAGALATLLAGGARAEDWPSLGLAETRARVSSERSGGLFDGGGWQHEWKTTEAASYRAVLAAPAVADGFVAFATQRNVLRVLSEVDGRLVWEANVGGAIVSSPAIWRGLVFVFGVNSHLYALRLADGGVVWQKNLGGMGYASPVVQDGRVYVATGAPAPRLFCLDAATGEVRWQAGDGTLNNAALSSVAVADGHVVAGELEGRYLSYSAADGTFEWKAEIGGRVALSSPLVVGGRVYVVPGGKAAQLFALDLKTGAKVEGWPLDLPMPAADAKFGAARARAYVTSSAAGDDAAIVLSVRADDRFGATATGEAATFLSQEVLFAIDPANRKILWSKPHGRLETQNPNEVPNHELIATPALYRSAAGELLIAATSSVARELRIFALNGDERWTKALAAPTRSSPVFANGQLVVTSDAGIVEAFGSATNRPPVAPVAGFSPTGDVNGQSLVVRWGAAGDPEAKPLTYTVRLDDDGEILRDWKFEATTSADVTQAPLPPLAAGPTYTFAVRAKDSDGALSAWSLAQSFQVAELPTVSVDGHPAASLADALAIAQPGSVIRLGRGRQILTSTLQIPPGVIVAGAGPHLTTLEGPGLATAVAPGAGSELRQLGVAGAQVGVSVEAADVRLRNVILRDNSDAGLAVTATGSADLVSGTIVRNGTGVRAAGITKVKNALVTRNDIGLDAVSPELLASRYDNVHENVTADYRNVTSDATDLAQVVAFAGEDKTDLRLKPAQPTTDKGDPADDFSLEPQPNGARINIGAFGNTEFAELSVDTGTEPLPNPDGGVAVDGGGTTPDADPANPPVPPADNGGCACATGGPASGAPLPLLLLASATLIVVRRRTRR